MKSERDKNGTHLYLELHANCTQADIVQNIRNSDGKNKIQLITEKKQTEINVYYSRTF